LIQQINLLDDMLFDLMFLQQMSRHC